MLGHQFLYDKTTRQAVYSETDKNTVNVTRAAIISNIFAYWTVVSDYHSNHCIGVIEGFFPLECTQEFYMLEKILHQYERRN